MWTPVRPVSVSAIATQVDLPLEKGTEGRIRGKEVGRTPVMVEFKQHSLTYIDRLLLKRHHRTPAETYPTSLEFFRDLKSNIHSEEEEEETTNSLTAEEEDFHDYYTSLFAVSASRDRVDPQSTTPQSCLVIEVLDETDNDINGSLAEDNKVVPSVQWSSSSGRTASQTTLTSVMSYKSEPPACPTAETPRSSKSSSKTPSSKAQTTSLSATAPKSEADQRSPHPLSSRSLPQFHSEIRKFSPSCSPSHKGSDSYLLPKPTQSSQFLLEPVSCTRPSQSPPATLESPQHSSCVPEYLLSADQVPDSQSFVTPKPNPKSLKQSPSESTPPDLLACTESKSLDTFSTYKSTSAYVNTRVSKSWTSSELSFDGGDEISSDCLGLALHEEDSSDEEPQMLRHVTRGRSRGEERGNPAKSHLADAFVPADAEREEDFQTDEPEQLSEPSMVLHSQSAGSGSELLCDLHEFMPLGLDMDCGHSDTPGRTHSDPLLTCQTSLSDSNRTKLLPAFRPLSRAAQEIMEICNVDQTGCEDPDLDTDTTAHTLQSLEQELRLLANVSEIAAAASVVGAGNSGSLDHGGNLNLNWGRVSEEQKEEQEAAQQDMQSVLFLS
ncbi:uncharacterized protein zbbx isoform X2 [Betta splendens]|uniref:Uncharacterized protein zbbx isoform X2 n=1 Tax=Betta splendens TaxID=158456 RepID=A0A6P7P1V1_BETSP|nr:uncharacterized protein zbbx isoform X2 [Betta splendens]